MKVVKTYLSPTHSLLTVMSTSFQQAKAKLNLKIKKKEQLIRRKRNKTRSKR